MGRRRVPSSAPAAPELCQPTSLPHPPCLPLLLPPVPPPLRRLPGIRQAGVFFLAETLDILFDPGLITEDQILAAVEAAGFTASLISSSGEVGCR